MKNKVKGKLCVLDYSSYPISEEWAKELVNYFDDICPKVIKLLKFSKCPSKVYIFTDNNDSWPAKTYENKMRFTPNSEYGKKCVTRGNKGFLIHEAAHFVQNYTNDIYNKNYWVVEAIADYARVKLGWDNNDNPNEYPCSKKCHPIECPKCGADFLIWVEKQYPKSDFVANLNKSLQNNQGFDVFVKNSLRIDQFALFEQYNKVR